MPWYTTPALLLALPAVLHAQQPERYTFDGNELEIYNLVGDARVEPSSAGLAVLVTRAGADAAKLRVVHDELDGHQTLRVIYPADRIRHPSTGGRSSTDLRVREDGTFGDDGWGEDHGDRHDRGGRRVEISSGGGFDGRADLRVQVPRGAHVELRLAVGSVTVTNVDGELLIDGHSGSVTSTGSRGRLEIDVGSGDVRVTQAEGELSVDTGSGSVEITRFKGRSLDVDTGSGDVTGSDLAADELSVDTGSGEIRLADVTSPRLSLETGSGGVTADLRQDIASLSVETGSGDIAINAPASLGARVEIETSSGDIETDFPMQVTRHGREHLEGTIGDGNGTIAMETGSGGIRLLKRPN
jgi:DUF4097 and DUF4098 domain-containing protein YvlB